LHYSEGDYKRPIHIVAADSSTSDSQMAIHLSHNHHRQLTREDRASVIVRDEYISAAAHHNGKSTIKSSKKFNAKDEFYFQR